MRTTEENEVRTTEKPSCWQEPEEVIYWGVSGTWKTVNDACSGWSLVYRSAEEAETDALNPGKYGFQWNKEPAHAVSLTAVMRQTRRVGRVGVRVKAYENGKWVIIKEYPVDVPLGH